MKWLLVHVTAFTPEQVDSALARHNLSTQIAAKGITQYHFDYSTNTIRALVPDDFNIGNLESYGDVSEWQEGETVV